MKTVLIRGEITADHVQKLWEAVATADDGEELGVVLDNCTGAQPWVMMAAAYAVQAYPSSVQCYIRGECLSAGLPVGTQFAVTTCSADPDTRFLPHGANPVSAAGQRRNRWQAYRLWRTRRVAGRLPAAWMPALLAGDCWLTAEEALDVGLIDSIGPPPDWARELLEEGGEGRRLPPLPPPDPNLDSLDPGPASGPHLDWARELLEQGGEG
jgi:hypothetical protein